MRQRPRKHRPKKTGSVTLPLFCETNTGETKKVAVTVGPGETLGDGIKRSCPEAMGKSLLLYCPTKPVQGIPMNRVIDAFTKLGTAASLCWEESTGAHCEMFFKPLSDVALEISLSSPDGYFIQGLGVGDNHFIGALDEMHMALHVPKARPEVLTEQWSTPLVQLDGSKIPPGWITLSSDQRTCPAFLKPEERRKKLLLCVSSYDLWKYIRVYEPRDDASKDGAKE